MKLKQFCIPSANKTFLANNRGFTLTEVIVAFALLVIGVLAVLNMLSVSMNSNLKATRLSVANNLAQAALEDICAKRIDDPLFSSSTTTPQTYDLDPDSSATSITIKGAGTYSATYSITLGTASTVNEGNITISVTVTGTGISPVTLTGFKRGV